MANDLFVYLLTDPRNNDAVFYVGQGVDDRPRDHIADAHAWANGRTSEPDAGDTEKFEQILDIESAGETVGIELLRFGLTQEEADHVESAAIDLLGLDRLTNKILGKQSQRCTWLSYATMQAATPLSFPADLPAVVVGIAGLHGGAMPADGMLGSSDQDILYNAQRYWAVNEHKRAQILHHCKHRTIPLIAMKLGGSGLVLGIWEISGLSGHDGQWIFETSDAPNPTVQRLQTLHINNYIVDPKNPETHFTPNAGVVYLNRHLLDDTVAPLAA